MSTAGYLWRLLLRAELLIIDDLSSNVDVNTEAAIWSGLFAEPDLTCLVVSHRRAALRRADRIVVLAEGRLAAAAPWKICSTAVR